MKKKFSIISLTLMLFLVVSLILFFNVLPKEEKFKVKVEEKSTKQQITFEVENYSSVDAEKIEKDIKSSFENIMNSINTDYKPANDIKIEYYNDLGVSHASKEKIVLYKDNGNFLTVHEMSHSLLGYGGESPDDNGHCTQEGFAIYLQDKYGDSVYPNYSISPHKVMNYLMKHDMTIPLNKLCSNSFGNLLFNPVLESQEASRSLGWLSYIHSGSFISYLISEYGIKDFEKVFNKDHLLLNIKDVYGKDINEIEQDWITFVNKKEYELKENDFNKITGIKVYEKYFDEIENRYLE
jgi:hypothetical protein